MASLRLFRPLWRAGSLTSRCAGLLSGRAQPFATETQGGSGPSKAAPAQRPKQTGLISPSGVPISSAKTAAATPEGQEVEITTAQQARQVLASPGAILLQVGSPSEAVRKKLLKLRLAASGRLPVVKMDCATLPEFCQALQIRSSPTILLMARGQVAAALELDLSPPAVTSFVETAAQLLGLKVELGEGLVEQLVEAEELEWTDPAGADNIFEAVENLPDVQMDLRVRCDAGRARCALRRGKGQELVGKKMVEALESSGHGRVAEVKQASAMVYLHERRAALGQGAADPDLPKFKAAAESSPADAEAGQALALALFWSGQPDAAFDAALPLLRRNKSEEVKRLAVSLVEALGPRHPKTAAFRKSLNNALFI